MFRILILYSTAIKLSLTSPVVRQAPMECPLTDGNLRTVKLFIKDKETCSLLCEEDPQCHFYKFYQAQDGKPPQCFFYQTCGRSVYVAPPECIMSRENCIAIRPFISSEQECQSLCQKSKSCGYYKYIKDKKASQESGAGVENVPTGRQIPISRLSDADTPEFCYLLSSCSKRIIDNHLCTVGQNNLLDVKLFTPSLAACRDHCEMTTECRYYYWYPISYSSAPLYCYMFRQCAVKDDEPTVALVMGGRHPGHYFMDSDDFNDIVTRNQVCPVSVKEDNVEVSRAGGVSSYQPVSGVLLCGGRNGANKVLGDCIQYNLTSHMWSSHSQTLEAREEAAVAVLDSRMFYMGGVGLRSVETLELSGGNSWTPGPQLPVIMSRSCAVSTGETIIITGGHNNNTESLDKVYELDPTTNSWTEIAVMLTPRRDHACLFIQLESSAGILVTGGLGRDDQVLASAEFYDVETRQWQQVSGLKLARTEHSMSLVAGLPTVIGGVNGDQFISSIEKFDKSSNSWNIPLERDWRIVNTALTLPRYEHTVATLPASQIEGCNESSNEI